MRLYIAIQSCNDIITNSSTEILNMRTNITKNILEEMIANCAFHLDPEEMSDAIDDIDVTEVDISDIASRFYGSVSSEELEVLSTIFYKHLGIDYKKWKGKLYKVELERSLYKTIDFLRDKFGAV